MPLLSPEGFMKKVMNEVTYQAGRMKSSHNPNMPKEIKLDVLLSKLFPPMEHNNINFSLLDKAPGADTSPQRKMVLAALKDLH